MKKRKHAGKSTAYGEKIVSDEDVEKWDMVSLFKMPKEERYALYNSIDYQEECVNKPKRQKADYCAAALKRAEEQVEEGERAQLKRAAQQVQHLEYTRATSVKQLQKMLAAASDAETAQHKVLSLQIAIRKHVNQIKKPVAVAYSKLSAKELQPLVEEMVKAERYSKPEPVGVPAMKDRDVTLFSDSFALALDAARQAKAELKTMHLVLMIEDGSFKALLKNKPSTRRNITRKPQPQTKHAKRTQPTQAELRRLDNATFVDDHVEWKMLKIEWSPAYDTIMVYYYDVASVTARYIQEDDLDDEDEDVESGSISEVLTWIGTRR